LPLLGPHLPSAEYLLVCLFSGKRMVERDLEAILEFSALELGAQVLRSVQCWPVKHWKASTEENSQVGLTQKKLTLAAASPERAPRAKIEPFMVAGSGGE
jgi:hypothetical protein